MPATVPAVLDSLILALGRYGTLSLAEVMAPAIKLADHGFPMYRSFRRRIRHRQRRFLEEWPSSAKVLLPGGRVPDAGQVFVQKDLAQTFRRLVAAEEKQRPRGRGASLKAARDLFYRGEIAREVVAFQRDFKVRDCNGFVASGLLSEEDLANYRAAEERPAMTSYRGVDVYKLGFWSQGPTLLQALNILENDDVKALGHNSAKYIHLLAEVMKLVFADREWYYADPNFVEVPEGGLLSKAYAARRRQLVNLERLSLELRPGDPYPFHLPPLSHGPIPTTIEFGPPDGGTTGTRVADREGNLFSATPSGGWFSSSPIIEGLGFALNTRGQIFWLDEGKANKLEPSKRPRTSLSPSLALKNRKPFLAWESPGGDGQDQINLQLFLNVVEFGMNIQEASDAPFFQILDFPSSFYPRQALPGVMRLDRRFTQEDLEKLEQMGCRIRWAKERRIRGPHGGDDRRRSWRFTWSRQPARL